MGRLISPQRPIKSLDDILSRDITVILMQLLFRVQADLLMRVGRRNWIPAIPAWREQGLHSPLLACAVHLISANHVIPCCAKLGSWGGAEKPQALDFLETCTYVACTSNES